MLLNLHDYQGMWNMNIFMTVVRRIYCCKNFQEVLFGFVQACHC
jgi:hypothetical protein